MRELELDGIHDDAEHVILVDSDGERYTLRIDEALRAAVRRDRPALGMIQAADAAPLRPREIQAMLRSGRSAEDIAEVSQVPLDHVRRYEGPVLAEREWAAQRARAFPVGRGGPSLDEVVTERLAARQATEDTAWDAWRRPDGSWTLELSFSAAGRTRQAHWMADLDNRTVSALDDEARWITDEEAPPEPLRGRARLMAVKSSVYDLEADGSFDDESRGRGARGPQRGSGPVSSEHPAALGDRELDALNARRGLRSVPPPEDSTTDSATVWSSLDEDSTTDPVDPARSQPHEPAWGSLVEPPGTPAGPEQEADQADPDQADQEALLEHARSEDGAAGLETDPAADVEESDGREPAGAEADDTTIRHQDTVDLTPLPGFDEPPAPRGEQGTSSPETPQEPQERQPRKPAKSAKNKRAAMPSWDEIVFGSKND